MSRPEDDRQRAVAILIPVLATCPPGKRLSHSDLVLALAKRDLVIGTHTMTSTIDHLVASGHLVRLSRRSLMVPETSAVKAAAPDPFAFNTSVFVGTDARALANFTSDHLRNFNQRLLALENRLL